MGAVIEKGKRRRARQRKKEKARQQYYGGKQDDSNRLETRNNENIAWAEEGISQGLNTLESERGKAEKEYNHLWGNVEGERNQYDQRTQELVGEAKARGDKYGAQGDGYGASADASLTDYKEVREDQLDSASNLENNDWLDNFEGGREGILGSADQLQDHADNAAAEYQSSADAAFQAAQSRNQKNALALAAGRGGNSIRTALATANSGNQQAALDQQVVKAQEHNQLNQMRNDAIVQAAGIRSGMSAQDQQAAQIRADMASRGADVRSGILGMDQNAAQLQAQRQQAGYAGADSAAGQRGGLVESNATYQTNMLNTQRGLNQDNAALGLQLGGAQVGANQDQRTAYMGSETAKNTAELGANVQTELQRAEAQKSNDPLTKGQKWTKTVTGGILG